jgi:EF-hand domain-containing family member B
MSLPHIAGCSSVANTESAAACLTVPEPPRTPEHVRKYRRSYFAAAGQRVVHPGQIEDMKKIDPKAVCGKITVDGEHVDEVMTMGPQTAFGDFTNAKMEASYQTAKREPLGKTYSRGHVLPDECASREFAFGVGGGSSQDAKDLIYPTVVEDDTQHHELYLKSHAAFGPGEQRNRKYVNMGLDPVKHRFGKVESTARVTNLVEMCLNPAIDESVPKTAITAKQVEDLKNTRDHLGRARNLGHGARGHLPADHIFGVVGASDRWDARTCIQGEYSAEEQAVDPDLGCSQTVGWRNVTTETRAYGCPSIRSDVEPPATRSVADNNNYGDDVPAEFLLYPPQFASLGIEDREFVTPRSKQEIFALFQDSGCASIAVDLEAVWERACGDSLTPSGYASVEEFRRALNAAQDQQ